MTKLTSYTCAKCGGVLNVDIGQAVFECPFCGNGFDLSDFHRGEVLNEAALNLKNREFQSAQKKYGDLLAVDENDFEAKRGMILAEGNIRSIDSLKDPEKLIKANRNKAKNKAEFYRVNSDELQAAYFEKLNDMFVQADSYAHAKNEIFTNRKYADKAIKSINDTVLRRRNTRFFFSLFFLFALPVLFLSVVTLYPEHGRIIEFLASIKWVFLGLAVLFLISLIPFEKFILSFGKNPAKEISDIKAGVKKRIEPYEKSLTDIRTYFEKAYSELQKMEESLVTDQGKADRKEQNQVAFSGPELTDKVKCSGCGGYLYADKKKNLLMCRSCGVAYGTSLFFGNIKTRALEALNACEYIEAEQRYLHALMLDPHDFEALRGRILSSARWAKVRSDADVTGRWIQTVRSKVDYALENALEKDKPYFQEYHNVVNGYEKLIAINAKIRSAEKQYKDMCDVRKHLYDDFDTVDYIFGVSSADKRADKKVNEAAEELNALNRSKAGIIESIARSCERITNTDTERAGLLSRRK